MVGRAIGAVALAAALAWAGSAWADYDSGKAAWDAGRPAEALTEWRAAADAGDRRAMLALGRARLEGLGAPQDFVLAHMWFNLAASRGEAAAAKERDALAAKMTPAERAEAQKRARGWRPGASSAGTSAAVPKPAPSASSAGSPPPRAIREAQSLLAGLGYDPGPVDGEWGGRTVRAYRAFLRDAGLPAAGALTPAALRALRRAAKGGGVAAQAARPPARTDAAARAAGRGDIDGLKAALAGGADPNARDARGRTALMHAADKGYTLLAEMLLAAEADPDVRAPDGATALFMAAARGHTEIVSLLSKAGADVSIRGPRGRTAVDAARARYGELKAAREKGEDPAVLALLEGKTLAGMARAEEARRRAEAEAEERRRKRMEEVARSVDNSVDKLRDTPWLSARDCPACPEMVLVPAGSFRMGSPSSEKGRYDDESPVHRVTIAAPFAVGKYEVTFAEWDACVSGGGCGGHRPGDNGWGRGRRSVINVSWKDAQAYVRWLSGITGREYRLLSESEWEYAARAGTTTRYYWGDDSSDQCDYANGADRTAKRRNPKWPVVDCDDGHYGTAPVGSFKANAFGLHDMLGNVWEWVEDCWNGSYAGAPSDGSAWEMGNCGRRDLRGGSWVDLPGGLRAANRVRDDAGIRDDSVGFRVARTLAR